MLGASARRLFPRAVGELGVQVSPQRFEVREVEPAPRRSVERRAAPLGRTTVAGLTPHAYEEDVFATLLKDHDRTVAPRRRKIVEYVEWREPYSDFRPRANRSGGGNTAPAML